MNHLNPLLKELPRYLTKGNKPKKKKEPKGKLERIFTKNQKMFL